MASWYCSKLSRSIYLFATRVSLNRARPVNIVTRCKGWLLNTGKVGAPISICTLTVKRDMSLTETIAVEKYTCNNTGLSRLSLVSSIEQLFIYVYSSLNLTCHIIRTALVFLPCILCSPLLLLPSSLCPTRTLLSLLLWSMETAGPVYIKLSQWASTRRDVFPGVVCDKLSTLQRDTKPHSWKETLVVLEKEWGEAWNEKIKLNSEVIGSGCCAQVYKGIVNDGSEREVAVKVVHPGLCKMLELDLMVMSFGASMLTWLVPGTDWLSLERAVQEFRELMVGQVDMTKECSNLVKFRENFKDDPDVSFPKPLIKFCGRDVLVEDWVDGVGIHNYMKDSSKEEERSKLAELGVDMLLKMVFRDNYWHGDLHPGNIMVTSDGKLCVLDTGVASSLSEGDRENLALTFRAIVMGESTLVGELFLERSYHECLDKEAFKRDMQKIVEEARSAQLSLDRIDVCLLLQTVFSTLMRHKVRLDANFSSVVIAIAIVEGLGRVLDPQLDLVKRAIPFLIKV